METATRSADTQQPKMSDLRELSVFRHQSASAASSQQPIKELRLGLVCYGGVSLAIYMHGITAELQRLVHASQAYCITPGGPNPFPEGTTERVYWEALDAVAHTGDGAVLQVVIDVIAGTSAGGINGVALAKALAHGLRQDPLREVWLEKASLLKLLLRSPRRILKEGALPPLNGLRMSRWVYQALRRMNAERLDGPAAGSLVPDEHELDLFITTTDCGGYRRTIELYDPETIPDIEYRHVLRFRYSPQENIDLFDSAHDRALTFAIRCTSSFPGVFPPVNLQELQEAVGPFVDETERSRFWERFFTPHFLENAKPEQSYLVDGGVLNNKPFDHALRAIAERTADHEVDRRLLFVEPHPVNPSPSSNGRPRWLKTVFAALSAIPSHQPIADALADLARHNQRALEFRQLITLAEPAVERLIREATDRVDGVEVTDASKLFELDIETIDRWAGAVQEEAKRAAGAAFIAYEAIKIGEVLGDLAEGICAVVDYPRDSRHAALVRRVVRRWAEERGLIVGPTTPQDSRTATDGDRHNFLRTFDLNFRRRRLRFLIRRINELYREGRDRDSAPTREQLDAVKAGLYGLTKTLRYIQSGRWAESEPQFKDALAKTFGLEAIARLGAVVPEGEAKRAEQRLAAFLDEHRATLSEALDMLGREIQARMDAFRRQQSDGLRWLLKDSSLPSNVLQQLLKRYLGFAYWDAVLYPLMAVSGLAELDPVEVIRISPNDTKLLEPAGVEARLKGVSVFHFNAFFKRKYRENDFLWGRLDGVERLLWLLNDVAQRQKGQIHPSLVWRGFKAVLDEEEKSMTAKELRKLIQDQRQQVERHLPASATLA